MVKGETIVSNCHTKLEQYDFTLNMISNEEKSVSSHEWGEQGIRSRNLEKDQRNFVEVRKELGMPGRKQETSRERS